MLGYLFVLCTLILWYLLAQKFWLYGTTVAHTLRLIDSWIDADFKEGVIGSSVAVLLYRQVNRERKQRLIGWRRSKFMGSTAVVTMLNSMRAASDDLHHMGFYDPAALPNAQRWLLANIEAAKRGTRSAVS